MKSVMFSEIVGAPRRIGLRGLRGLRSLSPIAAYGLTLAIGLPLLVLLLCLADPAAPLALIVLPALAGLALPLCTSPPGRLDVSTRFHARHMRATLDSTLGALGFTEVCAGPDRIRYAKTGAGAWRMQSVNVRICPHVLEVVGPIPILRALQAALAGTAATPAMPARAALSNRETIAGAMQISDNAERVAGMAE
jgi:hypothetical protein